MIPIHVTVDITNAETLTQLGDNIQAIGPGALTEIQKAMKDWLYEAYKHLMSLMDRYINWKSEIPLPGIVDRTGWLRSVALYPTEPEITGNTVSGSVGNTEELQGESERWGGGGSGGGITYMGLLDMIEHGRSSWKRKDGKPIVFQSSKEPYTGQWFTIKRHPGFSGSNMFAKTENFLQDRINKEIYGIVESYLIVFSENIVKYGASLWQVTKRLRSVVPELGTMGMQKAYGRVKYLKRLGAI